MSKPKDDSRPKRNQTRSGGGGWSPRAVPLNRPSQPRATSSYVDYADQDRARTTGMNRGSINYGSTVPYDTWNDMSPQQAMDQMIAAMAGQPPSGLDDLRDLDGVVDRGAAARPVDPDPLGWNAIAQVQNLSSGYGNMLKALQDQQAAVASGFDARTAGMNAANQQSIDRMNQIMADLNSGAAAARQNVAGSYSQGDQAIQALMDQYAGMVQARQPGVAQTIQAFGGDPAQAFGDPRAVQDMLTAQRANLARVGQADDALFAGRSNVYNGLNADVSTQRQQMFDQLMAKLLADRQMADAQSAQAQAQLAMQQQQAILQAQAAEQARRAQYV